jgi:hypothetical protein
MRLILPESATNGTVHDALRAFPGDRVSAYQAGALEPMFPPKGHVGRCRVCGKFGQMTEEHLPPRSALNKATFKSASFGQWMKTVDLEVIPDGRQQQGGVRGHMLCFDCNNFTGGRWGNEYKKWAHGIAGIMAGLPMGLAEIAEMPDCPGVGRVEFHDVYPGRFVRQALSMMMSISGSAEFGDRYPVIRDLVLGGDPASLPAGMKMFMVPCAGPRGRFHGGPWGQGAYDRATKRWTFVLEVALPPLAIQLIVDGDPSRGAGVDISECTEVPVGTALSLMVEEMMLGFTYSPYPCDFRTAGQMRADLLRAG